MEKSLGYALATATVLTVTACGGGGDSTPTPPASVPLAQALRTVETTGIQKTFNITGTASNGAQIFGVTGSLQLSSSAYNTTTTFNGQPALSNTSTINGTLNVNGQALALASISQGFITSNHVPLGSATSGGSYCVVTSSTPLPAAASVGSTGTYFTAACYSDSTKAVLVETETVAYTVSAGTTSSNLTATTISTLVNTSNVQTAIEQHAYLIDTSGGVTFRSLALTATDSGIVLTLAGT
jgi:hypothetical protein